jgi:carbonic anhydrase
MAKMRVLAIRVTCLLVLGLLSGGCVFDKTNGRDAKWSYSGDEGPAHWAELDPDYVLAALGGSQSPIDIVTEDVITADLPPLEFETQPIPLKLLNNGHTIEVIAPGGSTLRYGRQEFTLKQYHFHAPSEHTINGKHAAAEVHFVHSDGAGLLAVVAVLVEEAQADNPSFLSVLEKAAPIEAGEEKVFEDLLVDIKRFFPGPKKYFMYDGSLTTPPATEGVRWFVCAEPRYISRRQLDILGDLYFQNNRPVQPHYARTVLTPR